MSFLTGTSAEMLYASIGAGTQLASFTTEDNLQKTLPYVMIPAGFFFSPQGATGKSLRIRARGRLGTTGSPTFTWSLRILTSSTWSAGGIGFSSAALAAGTTQTLAPWYLDGDLVLRSLGAGAGSTLAFFGEIRSPLGLASPFSGTIPGNNVAFTAATFDHSVNNFIFLSAACSASNAANLIALEMLKVVGEN